MESILHTFGIDWRLLLVNGVNFGLLMAGLSYFLYKPVLAMLEERRNKVAAGVRAADEAEKRLAQTADERAEVLARAGREADELVAAARAAATAKEHELVALGEAQAARRVAEAEAEARELKDKALQESKAEVAKLIVLGMQKVK